MSTNRVAWSRAALSFAATASLVAACAEERNAFDTGTGAANSAAGLGGAASTGGGTDGGTPSGGTAGASGNAGLGGVSGTGLVAGGGGALGTDGGASNEAGAGGANSVGCTSTQPDPDCTCEHHDDHDYWMCKTAAGSTHADAKSACQAAGMALVEISGAVEDSWLYSAAFARTGAYWIGASDLTTEGTWTWDSGAQFWVGTSGGTPSGYAAWRHAEPNGSGNCASVEPNDVWDDRGCDDLLGFVCESPGGLAAPEPYLCNETELNNCTCSSNDGHDYVYCNYNQVWATARERCESLGMHLVQIDSDAENTFIVGATSNDAVWTGGNDRGAEGQWRWDGSGTQYWQGAGSAAGGVAVSSMYTDWNGTNEPNDFNGNQDCMVLQNGPSWDDLECGAGRRFVCESD